MNTVNIIGQSLLADKMDQMLAGGRIVHAYLFAGPAGSGKRTMSNLFAQALICEGTGDKPCRRCRPCRQFESGNHPDIIRITRQEDKTVISIEQIRGMQAAVSVKPYQAGVRICIIEDAHLMQDRAQNSLLKTLEEPPFGTLFFLLTENCNALLPTILSRCQIFQIAGLTREETAQILMDRLGLSRSEAMTFSALTQGIPGKALELAGNNDFRTAREALINGFAHVGGPDVWGLSDIFAGHRDMCNDMLDILLIWSRDILMLLETEDESLVINMDKISLLRRQCKYFTSKSLQAIIDMIEKSRRIIKANGNYQLTIDNMLLMFREGAH